MGKNNYSPNTGNCQVKSMVYNIRMIVYDKLWKTLKEKNLSQYKLIHTYGISTGQLDRLRKNGNVSTFTLNALCQILNCKLEDIAEFVDEIN